MSWLTAWCWPMWRPTWSSGCRLVPRPASCTNCWRRSRRTGRRSIRRPGWSRFSLASPWTRRSSVCAPTRSQRASRCEPSHARSSCVACASRRRREQRTRTSLLHNDDSHAMGERDRDRIVTREQRIVETFVELADTMVEDFDVVEFLHRLSERCVELLDCAEAGLLLADAAGVLRVMASSSERSDALDLLQSQNEEGPCFECYRRGVPVFSEDLTADTDRWPTFAPTAVRMGFRSVHAIPMRVRDETVGALNLFRAVAGRLVEQDMPLGQGMADIAAIALLQER